MDTTPGSPVGANAAGLSDDLGQQTNVQRSWGFQEGGLARKVMSNTAALFGTKRTTQIKLGNDLSKRLLQGTVDNALSSQREQDKSQTALDWVNNFREVDPATGKPKIGVFTDAEAAKIPGLAGIMNASGSFSHSIQEGRADERVRGLSEENRKHRDTIKDLQDQINELKKNNNDRNPGGAS